MNDLPQHVVLITVVLLKYLKATMANRTFDDYLREVHLSVEEFEELSPEVQDRYRLEVYNGWRTAMATLARLQPAPTPTPAPAPAPAPAPGKCRLLLMNLHYYCIDYFIPFIK
jgi:hypothetical protein